MGLEWSACFAIGVMALVAYILYGFAATFPAQRVRDQLEACRAQLVATRDAIQWTLRLAAAQGVGALGHSINGLGIADHAWTAGLSLLECARRLPLFVRGGGLADQALPAAAALHLAELWIALTRLRLADEAHLVRALEGVDNAIAELEEDGEVALAVTDALGAAQRTGA